MMIRVKYGLMVLGIAAFLAGCSSSDDNGSADLQRQLDMRADISPEDLAALRAQVEALMGRADISPEDLAGLRARIETLMGRADISPEDLAAIQAELGEFRMARMLLLQQEQARLDAMAAAGLQGGLARSPQAATYAASEADTVANLLPDGQTVFSPSTAALYRDWVGLRHVAQPDVGAAYVKSLSSDGAGGFHVTFVLDGTEHPVHLSADDRRPDIRDYAMHREDSDHYLWAWSESFRPDDDDWTDGNADRAYHDLHGWAFVVPGGEHRGALVYGLRTMPDNLPTGTAAFAGYMTGEWFRAPGYQRLRPGEIYFAADVNLEANLDDGTISGRFDNFRIPSWWTESGVDEPLEGNSIDIPATAIEDARFAADWVGSGPMDAPPSQSLHGFTGTVIGEFYGPAAEEAGGVLSGERPAMGGAGGELITGTFSTTQAAPDQ